MTPGAARTLWLLRHAKAAPDAPAGGTDHDRPLTGRGRRDAAALGAVLTKLGHKRPELVLTSTARRTLETAEAVAGPLGLEPDRRQRLYYGTPDDVLDELAHLDDAVGSVLVVGHNPTTHSLALGLLEEVDAAAHASLAAFPTCALAVLRVPAAAWGDLATGTASLAGFYRPPY